MSQDLQPNGEIPKQKGGFNDLSLEDLEFGFWFYYREGLVVTTFFVFLIGLYSYLSPYTQGYSPGDWLCGVPIFILVINFITGTPSVWVAMKITKQRIIYLFLSGIVMIFLLGVMAIGLYCFFYYLFGGQ